MIEVTVQSLIYWVAEDLQEQWNMSVTQAVARMNVSRPMLVKSESIAASTGYPTDEVDGSPCIPTWLLLRVNVVTNMIVGGSKSWVSSPVGIRPDHRPA